jgi:CheY-like chemotaxis protein
MRAFPKFVPNLALASLLREGLPGVRMAATATNNGETHRKTVLVVDDSAEVVEAIRHTLELCGLDVLHTSNPFAGIRMAAAHEPDAIVMDLDMPGMDGIEATRYLKRIDQTRDIPVIAFTGQASSVAGRMKACGFERIVPKEAGLESLETEIEEVLHGCAA